MKAILCTDLHFGRHNDSDYHNTELYKFFDHLISLDDPDIDDVYILGDMFQNRDKINILTLNIAKAAVKDLAQRYRVIILTGNHDLYYKDNIDVNSTTAFEGIDNVTVVEDTLFEGNRMFKSWVHCGEAWDEMINDSKDEGIEYLFGHFEFTGYKMNDHYVMEHGYSHKELKHLKHIYSGHYHMYQQKDNVTYIGTPFGYDMNDTDDDNRGYMIFDKETGDCERVVYDGPKIRSVNYRDFLLGEFKDTEDTYIRVIIDEKVDDVVLDAISDKISEGNFRTSQIQYKGETNTDIVQAESDINSEVMSIDDMVISHIKTMTDVKGVDNDLLERIYIEAKNED